MLECLFVWCGWWANEGLTPIYRLGCKAVEVSAQLAQISPKGLREKS